MRLTLAPSEQVSTWEKQELQECLWAGEWDLGEAGAGPLQKGWTLEVPAPGGESQAWGRGVAALNQVGCHSEWALTLSRLPGAPQG